MPELPEVETTIRNLKTKVLNRTFVDIWTDFPKMIRLRQGFGGQVKLPKKFEQFKKEIKGKKIQRIRRVGKNIIFDLSGNLSLLIHQKLTGHLLYGIWEREGNSWKSKIIGPLEEPINQYIHLIFYLDNDKMLALSDLRKFAKVELWNKNELENSKEFKNLGPDALEISLKEFKERLKKKKGKIKQILMDQNVIAGIGNIYSDEILFEAKIHPFKKTAKLKDKELEGIYQASQKILKKAIELQGSSISDYRLPSGEKGEFGRVLKVYRKEEESCSRCGTKIKRLKLGGRSAHFCPNCQTL